MNIILLSTDDWLDDERVRLRDRRCRHLIDTLKVRIGDRVRVGQLGGDRGSGEIVAVSADAIDLRVVLEDPPGPRHPMTLVVALPRPKMLRRILRTCAEFGVGHLHLIHSFRVEKSFWQSPLLSSERITEALRAGLERSGDTLLPRVSCHRRFRPFIEDLLPDIGRDQSIYVAHPGQHPTLGADTRQPSVVMIGPEGGFIPFEIELAIANGAAPRQLGSRILSVDTAVNGVLARELE